MPVPGSHAVVVGIDTGGTFTDLVLRRAGEEHVVKVPSTPEDPGRAVLDGLSRLGSLGQAAEVVHGTTVGLNALLTGQIGRVALVTNSGFRDCVEIGRQERPELYALHPERLPNLVPRSLRFEVQSRTWPGPEGQLERVQTPSSSELESLAQAVAASGAEAIAVCLLHSYGDPEAEHEVKRALLHLGLPITCSGDIWPRFREIERFTAALVNCALVPRMRQYLQELGRAIKPKRLSILMSSGGSLPAEIAGEEPVRVILSGPAGGVLGASRAARQAGLGAVVTLDMGGTSTDVAFHRPGGGLCETTTSAAVAGYQLGVPSLDIHTIGCGGGSIVHADKGHVLHVGPASAGADPGPACHGRGGPLTLTDAHVMLGHLAPGAFLGGEFQLDISAVRRGFDDLASQLQVQPMQAAEAVVATARASMRRAIGVMTMQRGMDPKDLPLVAFGGAGGLHAAALASALNMPSALIPKDPGVLSAHGMAAAGPLVDRTRSVLEPLERWSPERLSDACHELGLACQAQLDSAGSTAHVEYALDMRYTGQAFELAIPWESGAGPTESMPTPEESFHARHADLFGHRLQLGVELVALRARATVAVPEPRPERPEARTVDPQALRGQRQCGRPGDALWSVVDRHALNLGVEISGPAVVEEYSGTVLIPADWKARVTHGGHLLLHQETAP